ncbi:hypothetical protein SSX86_009090 [Deinandra increscens subsp. villosa]|uniref:AP2/ERF domain-containing protein n=1 Tax=Deinandra increscens subsp. villosa TaxID=3103831 RepID=A0AAP0DCL3_9ASTR
MRTIEHDDSSSTSSSSSSQTETAKPIILPSTNLSKRKGGRKKFKETRHPVYRGVRLRNGSKWVSEVREPGTKQRIWLGTFPNAEMAARAYDAATLALRGDGSPLNFTDSVRLIKRAESCSVSDVKRAAFEAALAFGPRCYENKSSSSSGCFEAEKYGENEAVEAADTGFVDEEMVFNMPGFYNSMAEGLVITPPGMKKGFDWSSHDDIDSDVDLTLWKY